MFFLFKPTGPVGTPCQERAASCRFQERISISIADLCKRWKGATWKVCGCLLAWPWSVSQPGRQACSRHRHREERKNERMKERRWCGGGTNSKRATRRRTLQVCTAQTGRGGHGMRFGCWSVGSVGPPCHAMPLLARCLSHTHWYQLLACFTLVPVLP